MTEREPLEVTVARIDERTVALERDVKQIKESQVRTEVAQTPQRASWPSILSSIAATGALVITLINMA